MEEDVRSRLKAAKEALEKNDYNAAGRHCKHVLKQDRNNDEAYLIFGKALMAQKQPAHAEMAFRKAIACNSAALSAWQGLVELYEGTDDVAKLQEALEGARKLAVATSDRHLMQVLETKLAAIRVADASAQDLGSSREEDDRQLQKQIQQVVNLKGRLGDEWKQAKLELLERCMLLITSQPSQLAFEVGLALCEEDDAGELIVKLGLVQLGENRISRIRWLGRRFLHFYPQHGFAIAAIALLQESASSNSRTKADLALLQQALRLESNCVTGWQAMAEAHLLQGAYVAALDCVKQGIKAVACWRESYGLSLVVAELQLKLILAGASVQDNPANAEQIFQDVLQEARAAHNVSFSALALEGLAKISVAQGNLEEALSRLDSVVSIDPHSHWAIAEQGWLSYSRGHFGEAVRCLEQAVALSPDVAIYHHRLGLAYAGAGEALGYSKSMSLKQLMLAATLDPEQVNVFRDLGHQFRAMPGASQKAVSCYQKAVKLDPNDEEAGNALCDTLEERNQGSVAVATCKVAAEQSSRAFWAWRRLGFLQVQEQEWAGAVVSLQHALRGYPKDAELWEALGLGYRQLGMLTAALKAYSGVLVLGSCSPLFSLLESGNILLSLSMFSKAIDMFREAIQQCPTHVVALFGLACALLGRARECIGLGAFAWSSALLEEAGQLAGQLTSVSGHLVAAWKLLGDIQATYSETLPCEALDIQSPSYATGSRGQSEDTLLRGIESWHKMQQGAAKGAKRAHQHALHLCPSDGSLYVDLGVSLERVSAFEGSAASNTGSSLNSLDVVCGGIRLEGGNTDCWTALGVLASDKGLKQHALIQALHIDGDHFLAWALLGQLYLREGNEELATHAFDRARTSNPLFSLPWAGMSFIHSLKGSKEKLEGALTDCLYAMHLSPTVDVQLGLAKLAAETKQLHLLRVYLALEQVIERVPHSPEAHNLRGLACESRSNFHAAIDAFHMARTLLKLRTAGRPEFSERYFAVSINLARVLCKAGKIAAAVREYEMLATGNLMKDSAGMCGYAVGLWWDGRKDLAIATVHQAAELIGGKSNYSSELVSVLSKLLYFKLGPSSALRDVHQLAQLDYSQANLCFTLLALAICSRQEHFLSELLPACSVVFTGERASEGHVLLTTARQILYPDDNKLVTLPLLKAIHLSPQDGTLRAKLGEVVLESSAGQMAELCIRCCPATLPLWEKSAQFSGVKCLANAALACSSCRTADHLPSFSSCHDFLETPGIQTTLQRWLHKEPWNILPHVYLISEVLMQAMAMGYPANLCRAVLRMCQTALALLSTLPKTKPNRHFQLHLLLCASESALQNGDVMAAINFAQAAAGQTPATSSFSGGFVQLARCYTAVSDTALLRNELRRLSTSLHPDDILGWIALVGLQQLNGFRVDTKASTANLEKAIQAMGASNAQVWSAVLQVVRAQGFLDERDLASAEKSSAKASAVWPGNSVLRLLHGAIALELAKEGGGTEFWFSAARVLSKVPVGGGQSSLPIAHALLVEAEAGVPSSRTSNTKFQKQVQTEWFSWPPGCRPAELYFRMGLLAKKSNGASTGSVDGPETLHTAKSWMLHAAHLNPTALRYWEEFV